MKQKTHYISFTKLNFCHSRQFLKFVILFSDSSTNVNNIFEVKITHLAQGKFFYFFQLLKCVLSKKELIKNDSSTYRIFFTTCTLIYVRFPLFFRWWNGLFYVIRLDYRYLNVIEKKHWKISSSNVWKVIIFNYQKKLLVSFKRITKSYKYGMLHI